MTCELVHVRTPDGLRLDGAFHEPQSAATLPVDAFLLLHGTGSNFYAPGVLENFANQAAAAGTAALRVNTRGHDGISSIPGSPRSIPGGATYETVADCRHDVTAWVEFLAARGLQRIVLVGHSLGGVKAIYAQAHDAHPQVAAIVGISPPRFCHERLSNGPKGDRFREEFLRMTDLVAQGNADVLVPVTQPLAFVATPAGYLEKYGPEDRYDYFRYLPRVTCPVLILIGSESAKTSGAFAGQPEALAELQSTCPRVTWRTVPGANINYANNLNSPFDAFAGWHQLRSPDAAEFAQPINPTIDAR